MRKTVTLDPDVVALLKNLMKERGLSFRAGLNTAVRESQARRPFRQRTFRMGFRPEIRLEKALALADAPADEEIVQRRSARK